MTDFKTAVTYKGRDIATIDDPEELRNIIRIAFRELHNERTAHLTRSTNISGNRSANESRKHDRLAA